MLYRTLKRLIERGDNGAEMHEKLDVLFAAGRITAVEYAELVALLEE